MNLSKSFKKLIFNFYCLTAKIFVCFLKVRFNILCLLFPLYLSCTPTQKSLKLSCKVRTRQTEKDNLTSKFVKR